MANYAIYKYEFVPCINRTLTTQESQSCQNAMEAILGMMGFIGRNDIYVLDYCREKPIHTMDGHERGPSLITHPGCYIVIDNRDGIFQMAVETNSAYGGNPDTAVKRFSKKIETSLAEYGYKMKVGRKYHVKKFQEIVFERLEDGDYVRKVEFEFPNPQTTIGIDASSSNSNLSFYSNLARTMGADINKFVMQSKNGKAMNVDDENNEGLRYCLALCASNGYNVSYHFRRSGILKFNKKIYALLDIDNAIVRGFINGETSIDFTAEEACENTPFSYQIIEILDDIRQQITQNETTVA